MSALPPKADMCGATRDVRFVPIADIPLSFDHLIRARQKRRRDGGPGGFGSLDVDKMLDASVR